MFEAVTFSRDRHDVCVVQQPIEQRRRQRCILREGRVPLTERQVARDDQTAALVQRRDDLEEQVRLLPGHWQIADLVDDQQPVRLDRPVHHRLQIVLRMGGRQAQHQIGRRREARLDAGLRGLVAQRHGQMRLAHAAGPHQHHVLVSLHEAKACQLIDLAAFDAFGEVVVELVQSLHHREARQPGHRALLPGVAPGGLLPQQSFQKVTVGHVLLGRLLACGAVALRHEGQLQAFAQRRDPLMLQVHAATPSATRPSNASYTCKGCCNGDGCAILLTTAAGRGGATGAAVGCGLAAAMLARHGGGSG